MRETPHSKIVIAEVEKIHESQQADALEDIRMFSVERTITQPLLEATVRQSDNGLTMDVELDTGGAPVPSEVLSTAMAAAGHYALLGKGIGCLDVAAHTSRDLRLLSATFGEDALSFNDFAPDRTTFAPTRLPMTPRQAHLSLRRIERRNAEMPIDWLADPLPDTLGIAVDLSKVPARSLIEPLVQVIDLRLGT